LSSSALERGREFDEGVPCYAGGTDGTVGEFGLLCDTSQAEGENRREGVVGVHLAVSEFQAVAGGKRGLFEKRASAGAGDDGEDAEWGGNTS